MQTKTLLQQLQSRIDLRSNYVTVLEELNKDKDNFWYVDNEEQLKTEREDQTLDKRLYAKLIEQERFIYNIYGEI